MFEKFLNTKETPEKVQAKIESLEDQIHEEKMKLLNNEERIRAEMEHVGGIEGLNEKIRKLKLQSEQWTQSAATAAALVVLYGNLYIFSKSGPVVQDLELSLAVGSGMLSMYAAIKALDKWWKVEKAEMLKEEVEAKA